jgi:hypothetical protein
MKNMFSLSCQLDPIDLQEIFEDSRNSRAISRDFDAGSFFRAEIMIFSVAGVRADLGRHEFTSAAGVTLPLRRRRCYGLRRLA